MPIELADFGSTCSLKPHATTDKRLKTRYNAPGPGSYNVKEIEPSMTSKFKLERGSHFGRSRSQRFDRRVPRRPNGFLGACAAARARARAPRPPPKPV